MKTNEELLKENAELRAKLSASMVNEESMRLAIKSMRLARNNNSGYEPSLSVFRREVDHVISVSSLTPAQHLADIQADAVLQVANDWIIRKDGDYAVRTKLIDTSNKLRGESK